MENSFYLLASVVLCSGPLVLSFFISFIHVVCRILFCPDCVAYKPHRYNWECRLCNASNHFTSWCQCQTFTSKFWAKLNHNISMCSFWLLERTKGFSPRTCCCHHDYWLLKGVVDWGYCRWIEICPDPLYTLLNQPLQPEDTLLETKNHFMMKRFKVSKDGSVLLPAFACVRERMTVFVFLQHLPLFVLLCGWC